MKIDSRKQDIWFTSDTHYWHKNMTYGESVWSDRERSCRKFDTTQEMSQHIVQQINKYVVEDSILFHLGDWSFGGINNIWNFRKQLRCKNIHLILGNHDHHISRDKLLENCRWSSSNKSEHIIIDSSILYNGLDNRVSAQELFSTTQKYLEVIIDGTLVMMLHFPIEDFHMTEWKKVIHLFGHVHGKIPHGQIRESGFRMDVGMDYAYKLFNEYRPFSWEEIIKLLGQPKPISGGGV